jgi:mRNA interferase MazF
MLSSGDVVAVELGVPSGREAGLERPAIVVTAQRFLDEAPSVVHVVPLTTTIRPFRSEVALDPDTANGLTARSAAQCEHLRAVSAERLGAVRGNVGPVVLAQIRETIGVILDLPT